MSEAHLALLRRSCGRGRPLRCFGPPASNELELRARSVTRIHKVKDF